VKKLNLPAALTAAKKVGAKYEGKQDLVRWFAFKEGGEEVNPYGHKNSVTNCYMRAMDQLGQLEIHCVPYGGPSEGQLPALYFTYFFRLLKQHGLVPPSTKALHRNGANCMLLPREGWDRHTLYMALCFYRQCDQRPDEIMRIMSLYKRLSPFGTNFLQCIHFLATYTGYCSGHYFMHFGAYGGAKETDLSYGQALAWFVSRTKEERLKLVEENEGDNYTYTFLARQAKEMVGGTAASGLEILNPKHAALYETPMLKEEK
jgi:hypothetical protein